MVTCSMNPAPRPVLHDMAGTTVADGGLVEDAFTAAAHRGENPPAYAGAPKKATGS